MGGLYDAATGEDYETARDTQNKVSEALTYQPRSDGGKAAVENIAEAFDQPVFNWLNETGESWGQNTNDYLEETRFAPLAPAAGILASLGPEVAAGAVTGGGGTAALRVARAAGADVVDGVKAGRNMVDEKLAERQRRNTFAPSLLAAIDVEGDTPNMSAGAAQAETARVNQANAQDLPVPITLTQGQATRNAAQMSDEYNLARQDPTGIAAPLAQLQRQQQADLHENLQYASDGLDRADAVDLSSNEALGRKVKATLDRRREETKAKTDDLYEKARQQGDLDQLINVEGLGSAFKSLLSQHYDVTAGSEMSKLMKLAERSGILNGRASINDIEIFRQSINEIAGDPLNKAHKNIAKTLKEPIDKALDNAPKSAAAYKRARAAYARNKREWDGNALVTQLTGKKGRTLSDSTPDERVYQKIKTASIADVKRMLRMAAKVDGGVNLIHTLGQRVMMDLVETAKKGRADGEFNSAAFKRELDKLDQDGKLDALYGPKRAEELRKISDVGETINRLPYGNSANISQSGNTIIGQILSVIGRTPYAPAVRNVASAASRAYDDAAAAKLNQQKVKQALDIEGLLSYE